MTFRNLYVGAILIASATLACQGCASAPAPKQPTELPAQSRLRPPEARAAYVKAMRLKALGDGSGSNQLLLDIMKDHPESLYGRKASRILLQSKSLSSLGTVGTIAGKAYPYMQKAGLWQDKDGGDRVDIDDIFDGIEDEYEGDEEAGKD